MNDESKANLFLLYLIGLAVFLFFKTDAVATFMRTSSVPMALLIHIITNPAYLLIIFGMATWRKDRIMSAFLAGIILVLAIDIISLPHLGSLPPAVTSESFTLIDSVFAQAAINAGMSYSAFRFVYYIIAPLLLIYLSVRLLGMRAFWQKIKGLGN